MSLSTQYPAAVCFGNLKIHSILLVAFRGSYCYSAVGKDVLFIGVGRLRILVMGVQVLEFRILGGGGGGKGTKFPDSKLKLHLLLFWPSTWYIYDIPVVHRN